MAPSASIERRSIWRVGPESTWTTIVPVVFIIVSLLSLVLLPIIVARKTARSRQEISKIAEPARKAANDIQTDLSAELDKIIAWQVTGQDNYRRDYFALVQQQETNRAKLMQLLPQLNGELNKDLTGLFVRSSQWHTSVLRRELMSRRMPPEGGAP